MKRRAFIGSMAVAVVAANTQPLLAAAPARRTYHDLLTPMVVAPPAAIQAAFAALMDWMKANQWLAYIKTISGIDLDVPPAAWPGLLSQRFPPVTLHGFEDFGGIKLVEPGLPEFSLLYHALASPRVIPPEFTPGQYPDFVQLDLLENYIFGSVDYQLSDGNLAKNYAVAVFAYEYRPAYKNPDSSPYAGFVYSRTGIARVGETPMNYDPVTRSYTNKPQEGSLEKTVAVAPARYGVFLAKKVETSDVNLYTPEEHDSYGWIFGGERYFLQPVQKLFNGDRLTGGGNILFAESHRNEKLMRIVEFQGVKPTGDYKKNKAPFLKISATDSSGATHTGHNFRQVSLTAAGSSILLASLPDKLIRPARQDGKLISFKVPGGIGQVNDIQSNRRYTSFRLQTDVTHNMWDYIWSEYLQKKYKPTRFHAPRNAPLFANIRHVVENGVITSHLGADTPDFESKVFEGKYDAALFEDSICDGCVSVTVTPGAQAGIVMKKKLAQVFSAFSLVSAPDFFPLSESYDLYSYDQTRDTSFLEGGIENLSYCRLPVNPNITNPLTDTVAFASPPKLKANTPYPGDTSTPEGVADQLAYDVSDTMIAIVSGFRTPTNKDYAGIDDYKLQEKRDYQANTFLSDSSAFVFAPGWDATYSSQSEDGFRFLATFGLGSPFPEDMKLCAAANGMWPVASPDAARTFMGSLDPIMTNPTNKQRTPTAVPLTDEEIGIYKSHPGLADTTNHLAPKFGWDGEQGPCLEKYGNEFCINFTDIGRADYVANLLDGGPGFDLTALRQLTCQQLIARMEALRFCKLTIEHRRPPFSHHWLISAEEIGDWASARAIGVPDNLVGNNRSWAKTPQPGISGSGFLFVLSDTHYDEPGAEPKWVQDDKKRRRMAINQLFICQVSGTRMSWCAVPPTGLSADTSLTWQHAGS
jgi:hypothetical protein